MEEKNYKSRGEMVGETLKQEILDLRLKPGQMISENDVCDRFGVSRTPVREALRLLQEQGFVETVPYRGTYVTLLSLDNIKQMIYMRVAVETMVLRDFIAVQSPMVMEDISSTTHASACWISSRRRISPASSGSIRNCSASSRHGTNAGWRRP